ncbi:Ger(x)C family spore germination C-terminal domain-containing protein [Paenibacillus gansuensis]|uniref:Ger(X)C family spore germination C-terminal domain-containing protein n=1 Tax=Paenibacillus gansuensis TaxID=306542 RepID=A0ABW5PCS1_9BACL
MKRKQSNNPMETFILKLIRNRYKSGSIELSLETDRLKEQIPGLRPVNVKYVRIVIDNINSSVSRKLVSRNPLTFAVEVRLKGLLLETSEQMSFGRPESVHAIEAEINRVLENQAHKLLQKLTRMNSDPIGFGEIYRKEVYRSHLTRETWRELYPESKFKVSIKSKIVRTGEVD